MLGISAQNNNQDKDIIAKDAVIEKVETGYSFTEGSTANSNGIVFLQISLMTESIHGKKGKAYRYG